MLNSVCPFLVLHEWKTWDCIFSMSLSHIKISTKKRSEMNIFSTGTNSLNSKKVVQSFFKGEVLFLIVFWLFSGKLGRNLNFLQWACYIQRVNTIWIEPLHDPKIQTNEIKKGVQRQNMLCSCSFELKVWGSLFIVFRGRWTSFNEKCTEFNLHVCFSSFLSNSSGCSISARKADRQDK